MFCSHDNPQEPAQHSLVQGSGTIVLGECPRGSWTRPSHQQAGPGLRDNGPVAMAAPFLLQIPVALPFSGTQLHLSVPESRSRCVCCPFQARQGLDPTGLASSVPAARSPHPRDQRLGQARWPSPFPGPVGAGILQPPCHLCCCTSRQRLRLPAGAQCPGGKAGQLRLRGAEDPLPPSESERRDEAVRVRHHCGVRRADGHRVRTQKVRWGGRWVSR